VVDRFTPKGKDLPYKFIRLRRLSHHKNLQHKRRFSTTIEQGQPAFPGVGFGPLSILGLNHYHIMMKRQFKQE